MKKSDFFFELPEELIAQTPIAQRDASRLMHLDRLTGEITHRHFHDLPEYLQPGVIWEMTAGSVFPDRERKHAKGRRSFSGRES